MGSSTDGCAGLSQRCLTACSGPGHGPCCTSKQQCKASNSRDEGSSIAGSAWLGAGPRVVWAVARPHHVTTTTIPLLPLQPSCDIESPAACCTALCCAVLCRGVCSHATSTRLLPYLMPWRQARSRCESLSEVESLSASQGCNTRARVEGRGAGHAPAEKAVSGYMPARAPTFMCWLWFQRPDPTVEPGQWWLELHVDPGSSPT